jgi:hypothetical protein
LPAISSSFLYASRTAWGALATILNIPESLLGQTRAGKDRPTDCGTALTNWNFVLWRVWHGLLLIIHRAYSGVRSRIPFIDLVPARIREVLSIALMQYSVLISWILFRITDTQKMFEALRKSALFDGHLSIVNFGAGSLGMMSGLMIVMVFFCVHFWAYTSDGFTALFRQRQAAICGFRVRGVWNSAV